MYKTFFYLCTTFILVFSCYKYPKGNSFCKQINIYLFSEKRNPCEDLRCGPGEDCVVNQINGILLAKCVCPTQCPNYGDSVESSPVCSSHGVDYQSSCHLRHHACESKTNITVKFFGRCGRFFQKYNIKSGKKNVFLRSMSWPQMSKWSNLPIRS